jgi:hypothetical protein
MPLFVPWGWTAVFLIATSPQQTVHSFVIYQNAINKIKRTAETVVSKHSRAQMKSNI